MPDLHNEVDMSWEGLKKRAKQYLAKMLTDAEVAPDRGQYNPIVGGYSKSKRDVVKAATNNLKNLNTVAQAIYGKDVVSFAEDKELELPDISIVEEE